MNQIKDFFLNEGFLDVSIAEVSKPISYNIYKAQVMGDNTGSMKFLKDHLNQKKHVDSLYRSAFVALYPYYPSEDELKSSLRVSLYAKSKDYHNRLSMKLDSIISKLIKLYPNEEFLSAVDSSPILEKDLAYKAGLGWFGKNTCLLDKKNGSLFFVSEILTSLHPKNFESLKRKIQSDHCGTCTKCIEICPTQALSPHKLEVEKCISYRTIEKKNVTKEVLESPLDSWFFGCDLCQTVCPWNEKVFTKEKMKALRHWKIDEKQVSELKEILESSNKALDKKYKDFALSRPRGKRLKRNALQIIYENKITSLKKDLERLDLGELNELRDEVIKSL